MTKRMLVDATHPEETRVAIVDSYRDTNRLDDLDFDLASKPILRGNIYLAKVMRIEPSLQAAFVEYGGNRHGFLPFSEIHPDYFRIPMADRPHDEQDEDGEGGDDALQALDADYEADLPISESDPEPEPQPDDGHNPSSDESSYFSPQDSGEGAAPEGEQPPTPTAPPSVFGDDEVHDSLITDFGNAVVASGTISDVPMDPTPVDNVGGDVTERFVRRHRPRYKIQEVVKRGQIMLIQVVKEERGNKGAALTTYLSLAGRYCVLMPNTGHGGGVSRKITNHQDRRRMKEILDQLDLPEGMAVILRTAGLEQDPPEIQRDLEYLLRLWDNIREQTLQSTAPALIYEEANLIKRAVRDLFSREISEILVSGKIGYNRAREFMSALMPDQVEKIKLYEGDIPLFFRYGVEGQIDKIHNPIVQLRSGGYIVIGPTEALVAIDVNSGRSTRERHIEETALKTNLEAADEIARQLRLRDLAGLVVIDFIDMEDGRNNAAVERRLKEAMKNDRARLQIGRISPFGLLELSRQRLRPSLHEINFEKCSHCAGVGFVRSVDSAAFSILRAIEEEGIRQRGTKLVFHIATPVAMYIFNNKRDALRTIEQRYDLAVQLIGDETQAPSEFRLEKSRNKGSKGHEGPAVDADQVLAEAEQEFAAPDTAVDNVSVEGDEGVRSDNDTRQRRDRGPSRRRFRQPRRDGRRPEGQERAVAEAPVDPQLPLDSPQDALADTLGNVVQDQNGASADAPDSGGDYANNQRRRRRGRRGGRSRGGSGNFNDRWQRNDRQNGDTRQGNGGSNRQSNGNGNGNIDIPANVHEIDTTPRAHASASPLSAPEPVYHRVAADVRDIDTSPRVVSVREASSQPPQRASVAQQPERDPSSYEVVNPPGDRPKGGWWRRLTGQ